MKLKPCHLLLEIGIKVEKFDKELAKRLHITRCPRVVALIEPELGDIRICVELLRMGLVKDWHHRRLTHRLQIEQGHESERVARDCLLAGVVDAMESGPAFYVKDKRLDTPINVTVHFH